MSGRPVALSVQSRAAASAGEVEARLIARIVQRDGRAFGQLYRIYHPRLSRFIGTMIRSPQLAEEVLDDTMMVIWRRPESFDGACKVSTWVFGIAYRTALNGLRRHDEPVEDLAIDIRRSEGADPEQHLGGRQVRDVLRSAMAELSPDHRAVIDFTYFQEFGYREIAEIMDCPVDTVKTRMFHARRHLRRVLDGRLEDWL